MTTNISTKCKNKWTIFYKKGLNAPIFAKLIAKILAIFLPIPWLSPNYYIEMHSNWIFLGQTKPLADLFIASADALTNDATAPRNGYLPRTFLSIFSVRSFTHIVMGRKAYRMVGSPAYSIRHLNLL